MPGGRLNAEPGGGRASGAAQRRRLDTKPRFVRRLIAERRIEYHKVGRHVRISESALADFIEAGKVPPMTAADLRRKLKGAA